MFIDGKIFKAFRFEDLNSLISLEKWIRENTALYRDDQSINSEHFKIFINYLRDQTNTIKLVNKREWLDQLDLLLDRLSKTNE